MELHLHRKLETKNSTAGVLLDEDGNFICFIIEDGFRETKVFGETRIPAGRYKLIRKTASKFLSDYKARWGHTYIWKLEDVPGFKEILIHVGNTSANTNGCLLTNTDISFDRANKNWIGQGSREAYVHFWKMMDQIDEDIYINIADPVR